jgi:hypothetical protein
MSSTILLMISLVSLAGLGVFHKIADCAQCRARPVTVALFLFSSTFFWIYVLGFKRGTALFPPFTVSAVGIAVLFGALAGISILAFQIGIRYGSLTASWLIINLSTFIPSVLSLVVYKEYQQDIKLQYPAALILIAASIFLLWRDKTIELKQAGDTQKQEDQAHVV